MSVKQEPIERDGTPVVRGSPLGSDTGVATPCKRLSLCHQVTATRTRHNCTFDIEYSLEYVYVTQLSFIRTLQVARLESNLA